MNRLRAGPVTKVDGACVIPVSRLTRVRAGPSILAALAPVAVLLVRHQQVHAWTIDGTPSPLDQWLTALPELAAMIADAKAGA